jgi:hypothetical protein
MSVFSIEGEDGNFAWGAAVEAVNPEPAGHDGKRTVKDRKEVG